MRSPTMLVAIHDVAPATLPECRELLSWIVEIDSAARLTLLVVPQFHWRQRLSECRETRAWLDARLAHGDEIALHGYSHLDEAGPAWRLDAWWRRRILTKGEGEFAALSAAEARERVERGLTELRLCGWSSEGFVPPAWQIGEDAWQAVRTFPFRYCTDARAFRSVHDDSRIAIPVIGVSSRSTLRRRLSALWLRIAPERFAAEPVVRVALHPEDARHSDMRRAWCETLTWLRELRRPMTKLEWLRRGLGSETTLAAQKHHQRVTIA